MDWNEVVSFFQKQGILLLEGLMVLIVGIILVRWLTRFMEKRLKFKKADAMLLGFIRTLIRALMYIIVVVTAISVMGIPLTSVITLIASGGVAVSLAMQGALSNLVGGMTLLVLKPIKAGDYVKVGELEGTVQSIGAFYTEMNTYDNRHISMPNSSLTHASIINYTREGTRRLDKTFSVSYASDMDQVFAVLHDLIRRCPGALPDPAPAVHLNECADSGMIFSVRVWVKTADYWNTNFFLVEEGKRALDAAGIQIPFPQMDVHIQ